MKRRVTALVLSIAMALVLAACGTGNTPGSAGSQAGGSTGGQTGGSPQEDSYTMRIGWTEANDPDSCPASFAIYHFKDIVEERSNGRIKVELFGGGQLGTQQEMMEQVQQGVLEASLAAPLMNIYPDFNLFNTPFLVSDVKTMRAIFDPTGDYWAEFIAPVNEATGLKCMGICFEGLRHLTNSKREVRVPADISDLKIRVQDKAVCIETWNVLGCSATPISWNEVYSALQTHVCDGQENPLFNIAYANLQEVQSYLTLTGHELCFTPFVINGSWYSALPADLQAVIDECSTEFINTEVGKVDEREAAALTDLENAGMTITELTDEEHQAWVDGCQAHMIEWISDSMTHPELLKDVMSRIAAVEG